jgi:hypothetical protein
MCHAIVIDFHRFVLPTRRTMGGFAQFMGGSPQGDGNRPGHQAGLGPTGGRLWMDWLWMDECSSIFSKRRPEVLGILVVFRFSRLLETASPYCAGRLSRAETSTAWAKWRTLEVGQAPVVGRNPKSVQDCNKIDHFLGHSSGDWR